MTALADTKISDNLEYDQGSANSENGDDAAAEADSDRNNSDKEIYHEPKHNDLSCSAGFPNLNDLRMYRFK